MAGSATRGQSRSPRGRRPPGPEIMCPDAPRRGVGRAACRWRGLRPRVADDTVWIRPRLPGTGTIWTHHGLAAAVRQGEAAVTGEMLARIRSWTTEQPDGTSASVAPMNRQHPGTI